MGFGTLRVLKDDAVAPAKGFATHPHRDTEIVSIPISGALQHKDSVGNASIIRPGEFQSMSAGKGIEHSEWNPSADEPGHFLQIWMLPRELNVLPRCAQWNYAPALEGGGFARISAAWGVASQVLASNRMCAFGWHKRRPKWPLCLRRPAVVRASMSSLSRDQPRSLAGR